LSYSGIILLNEDMQYVKLVFYSTVNANPNQIWAILLCASGSTWL